jgi:hypothetical protein
LHIWKIYVIFIFLSNFGMFDAFLFIWIDCLIVFNYIP